MQGPERDSTTESAGTESAGDGKDPMERDPSQPRSSSTARDHLANERTLLAWSRTSIAVIGLGFVVARFGLLIRELGGHLSRGLPEGTSTALGTALVLAGTVLLALALLRYLRAGHAIDEGRYAWSPLLGILLTGCLLLVGLLLAVYLVITA